MKIAFCKYAGLASGGTEKYLQSLALLYKGAGHEIDYYYTHATPIEGTAWQHPDTSQDRKNLVEEAGINTIHVKADARKGAQHNSKWVNTNFFELFSEEEYYCLVTAGDGRREFPYSDIKKVPIIHTVHGWHAHNAPNIHRSVLLCNWQAEKWKTNGGDVDKLVVIPPLIPIPEYEKNCRAKFNIPKDVVVFGLHQAPGVASLVSLQAFAKIANDTAYYVILCGDGLHRNYVKDAGLKNVIFLPRTSDASEVHSFLSCIDIYAHCRKDGEVCSASLIEAMAHGKPIITHVGDGTNMGHIEQADFVAQNVDQYADHMKKCMRMTTNASILRYKELYDYNLVSEKLLDLIK